MSHSKRNTTYAVWLDIIKTYVERHPASKPGAIPQLFTNEWTHWSWAKRYDDFQSAENVIEELEANLAEGRATLFPDMLGD